MENHSSKYCKRVIRCHIMTLLRVSRTNYLVNRKGNTLPENICDYSDCMPEDTQNLHKMSDIFKGLLLETKII